MIGFCQRISWKDQSFPALAKRLLFPGGMALTASVLFYIAGVRHVLTLVTCWFGMFVVFTMLFEVGETLGGRFRNKSPEESSGRVVLTMLLSNRRLYAAYIFHVGIVLMYLGIAVSSAYQIEQEVALRPGASATVGNFRFQYGQLSVSEDSQKAAVAADIKVFRNEQPIAMLTPQKHFYGEGDDSQMTTEIGLHISLQQDIYVILAGWKEDHTATFTFIINPMIIWIWVGGLLVCSIGMLIIVIPTSWGEKPSSQA